MLSNHTRKFTFGAAMLIGAVVCVVLALLPSSPQRAELESGDDPELRAARAAFQQSDGAARTAQKELDEVENNVPGWMAQFSPSVLKDAVDKVESASGMRPHQDESSSGKSKIATQGIAATHVIGQHKVVSRKGPVRDSRSKGPAQHFGHEIEEDPKLKSMYQELSGVMSKAQALRRTADLHKAQESGIKKIGQQRSSKLTRKDATELGELFRFNTVLHTLSKSAKKIRTQFDKPVVAEKQTVEAQKRIKQNKQGNSWKTSYSWSKGRGSNDLQRLRDEDMAKAESKAALQQAAQLLLKQLHGTKDKWLQSTLTKIASNSAQVNDAKSRLASIKSSSKKQSPCDVALGGLPACSTSKERQQQEATRLLDHMLDMAHKDFHHMEANDQKVGKKSIKHLLTTAKANRARLANIEDSHPAMHPSLKPVSRSPTGSTASDNVKVAARGRAHLHPGQTDLMPRHIRKGTRQGALQLLTHDMAQDLKDFF